MKDGKIIEIKQENYRTLLRISKLNNKYITECILQSPFEIKNCLAVPLTL